MALPSKTTKLIEQTAQKLEKWANGWGKRLLKDRPNNLNQIRQSLLADLGNTDFPHLSFRIEFYSGLKEALEKFDYVLETLHQYMPNTVKLVQKKHDDVMAEAESVVKLTVGSCDWLRKLNNSRNCAISLAKTLRHVSEMAREDLPLEKQKDERRSKKKPRKSKPISELFTFRPGQVLFDGRDLNVGTGAALEILETLVRNFGNLVPFQTLDGNSPQKEASEKIRTAIGRIRRIIKSAKIPAVIENRKGEGYLMRPSTK